MAKDILGAITGTTKSTKVSATGDTSFGNLEKALMNELDKREKKRMEESRKQARATAKIVANDYAKYQKALGITNEKDLQKLRLKLLAEQNKKDQTQKIKDLIEYQKKSAELQREYNRTILDVDSGATFKERVGAICFCLTSNRDRKSVV